MNKTNKHYERLWEWPKAVLPMKAKLTRSDGTWWLEYEDGHTKNLHHSSALVGGFRKAAMENMCFAS
jgi:hypothetical protein